MTAWNERLKSRMKERKTTQEDLAVILDISQSSVGHYVSGRRNPRKAVLEKMADELEVSMDWLLGKTELPPIDKREFFPVPVLSAADAAQMLSNPKGGEYDMELMPVSNKWIRDQKCVAEKLCVCIVEDDAMAPKLNVGDKVVINCACKEFINGKVFALLVNNALYIRRAVQGLSGASWTLSSDNKENPTYRDEVLMNSDVGGSVEIIGRVALAITTL
jgi:transcriptional regulator with XRE-family HTH domain|tara:strand:+ start:569 stop:1222 length:654 start_codon:yes stop_codon:yes gene_type:complete